jgi:5'-nucleotidase (lipoprotein e(P4) family)
MKETIRRTILSILPCLLIACATEPAITSNEVTAVPVPETQPELAYLWTANAAEYYAVSQQVYRSASDALPGFIADQSWSAIPYQTGADELPPAIIMDIDQTLVNGVDFQLGYQPPFTADKFNGWNATHTATAVPGAPEFVQLARDAGVQVFFLTNRFCDHAPQNACQQKTITMQDLYEAGIPAVDSEVSLAGERPGWGSEKKVRRDYIAERYRVIMLFGDDLGDFIPCVRRTPSGPCTQGGTVANRLELTTEHVAYWGAGWYILPNPMYGSWTSVP